MRLVKSPMVKTGHEEVKRAYIFVARICLEEMLNAGIFEHMVTLLEPMGTNQRAMWEAFQQNGWTDRPSCRLAGEAAKYLQRYQNSEDRLMLKIDAGLLFSEYEILKFYGSQGGEFGACYFLTRR